MRTTGDAARAYPWSELERAGGCIAEEEIFGGDRVRVEWSSGEQTFSHEISNDALEVIEGYWLARAAFHPDSEVFRAADSPAASRCRPGPSPLP